MIFNKKNNSRLIEKIYQNIIERSRLKYFYLEKEVNDTFESRFEKSFPGKDLHTWNEVTLKNELPTTETIQNGLLPNETKWLLTFLNFEKGCFLGQEPVSRVNFRGRPRRKLITNEAGVQEFIKI